MGFDLGDLKEKVEDIGDKIPDEVIDKAKDLATKENLEKVKDKAEELIDKLKK